MSEFQGEHAASEPSQQPGAPKKRNKVLIAALVVVVVVCLAGAAAGGLYLYRVYSEAQQAGGSSVPATTDELLANQDDSEELVDNPVDFGEIITEANNSDIYAWIYVPGTEVNYPVCQSPTNDEFYLDHDETGADAVLGAVYSEASANSTDFQDPVTILYGHNGVDDTMFGSLHDFEDKQFFKQHKKIYIYTPGHIYTYKIISAFTTDDTHIMYRYYYFTKKSKHKEFLKLIQNPDSISVNKRSVKGIDTDSKILVLSTCNTGALSQYGRYIVCGVMTDDQPTY